MPRPLTVAGYALLVAGLIAPFALPFGAHIVICLMLCGAGLLLIVAGASGQKSHAPRHAPRRRAGRPNV